MRTHLRNARNRTGHSFIRYKAFGLFSFALLICLAVFSQPIHSQTINSKEKSMTHYALIFHIGTRTLTAEEQKQRTVDIAAWVKEVSGMGVDLDPRAFGESVANFSTEGNTVVSRHESSDPKLSNLVFFDAPSREEAVHIARIHPGLKYGVTVEVREWTSPRVTLAK
jgi:hypothetical protein